MRSFVWTCVIGLCLTPTTAWAQAVVTGSIRDEGGAAIAGAIVRAESPSLIEPRSV